MAGNYPDAPSWRMAYDRDGSIVVRVSALGVVTQLTEADAAALNDEAGSTYMALPLLSDERLVVIFPELRDVDAYFLQFVGSNLILPAAVEVSGDTTNGVDGAWSALPLAYSVGTSTIPGYRAVTSSTALAVRAVRVRQPVAGGNAPLVVAFHLYGERSPGQALNALELWHPSSDEKLPPAWLDWGNTPRGSSEDRTFRVKNVSTTSTAEAVRVAFDVLTDGSPSVPGQHLLSYGGGSFLAQVNVGDLAPGAISGPVTLRRVTASNAQLGLFAFRVFAEPDAWA